jgi:integrase
MGAVMDAANTRKARKKFARRPVNRVTISKTRVDGLAPGQSLSDDQVRGFMARKLPSGSVAYGLRYTIHGRQKWLPLGLHGRLTPDQARTLAKQATAQVASGLDPVRQRQTERIRVAGLKTLGELTETYLAEREDELRPRTHTEYARHLRSHWKPLHKHTVAEISRADVVGVIGNLVRDNGKVAADRAKTALGTFYAWAIDRGYCETTPVTHIKRRSEGESGDRVLSEAELVEIWKACPDDDYGRIVKLLMLTALRKTEMGNLPWAEVDTDKRLIEIPRERCKNHRAMRRLGLDSHLVPLSDQVLAIIGSVKRRDDHAHLFGRTKGAGFSGWSRCKARLDKALADARKKAGTRADMPEWDIHDIRRSVTTHLAESRERPGADGQVATYSFALPHVIEMIENRLDGHKGGTAGVYNKAIYLPERKRALDLWGDHLAALIKGRPSNIIPMQQRGGAETTAA